MKIDSIETARYLEEFLSVLEESSILNNLVKSYGLEVTDWNQFQQDFIEEIELVALKNKADFNDPTLTKNQITDIFFLSVVKDSISSLKENGMVEEEFSLEEMTNIINLTELGKNFNYGKHI